MYCLLCLLTTKTKKGEKGFETKEKQETNECDKMAGPQKRFLNVFDMYRNSAAMQYFVSSKTCVKQNICDP